jgi:chorismate dehydratase
VFAVWACRAAAPAFDLESLRRDFTRSRDHGLSSVGEIAAEYAPRLGLSARELRIYLTENIDYTLDEDNLAGLRLFYQLAPEVGAIPAVKDLDFV